MKPCIFGEEREILVGPKVCGHENLARAFGDMQGEVLNFLDFSVPVFIVNHVQPVPICGELQDKRHFKTSMAKFDTQLVSYFNREMDIYKRDIRQLTGYH